LAGARPPATADTFEGSAEGYRNLVRAFLRQYKTELKQGQEPTYGFAESYARLGDKDQALAWLERAYAKRLPALIYLKADPMWDPLRGDPRFEALTQRIGLLQASVR